MHAARTSAPTLTSWHSSQQAKDLCKAFEEKLAVLEGELEVRGPPCPLSKRCQLLLSDLRRNPLSEWFRRRSDWETLGPAYIAVM